MATAALAPQSLTLSCRFPGCENGRLPKSIWCGDHRYPEARADGRCLATGCGYDAYESPWCLSHLRGNDQREELDAMRDAIRALLADPRSLDPEGCRKPMLDGLALAVGVEP